MLFGLADIRLRRMFIDEEASDDDRKRREHQRLGSLLGYCEAATCRRQVLLRYFGERSEACGNCDACTAPVALADGTAEAKQILDAIRQTGTRFGAAHVVDVLMGAANERIEKFGHGRLAAYGSGKGKKREEWQSLIRQLVAANALAIDIAGYGALTIAEEGRRLMRGETTFSYRPSVQQKRAARKEAKATAAATLSDENAGLLDALKQLRLRLAKQRGVAAYLVFSDRSLIDMAEKKPHDLDTFGQIHGVGAAKQKGFAAIFLEAIRAHGDGASDPV
jgi:ATP-dependent DNA helicase RecQ